MTKTNLKLPDERGYFGDFGGRFITETLMPCVLELEAAWQAAENDKGFKAELKALQADFVGRPSPLYHAEGFSALLGNGAEVYFKREDLNHTGAHKINNCLGQILLAKRMGKTRVIAETGAGQHGVATATVAAKFGLRTVVYMGEIDIERQKLNVERMRLLGSEVRPVACGSRTLKDALNEALRDWVANIEDTFYVIGSVAGPHPYPKLVRSLQSVIGVEARRQCLEKLGRLPDKLVACVGGGSNALGLFHPFLADRQVEMIGVEAAGAGLDGKHSATLTVGKKGILHGSLSYVLQDDEGQVSSAHSISAGLDYPGVGPEHAFYKENGRIRYEAVTDEVALRGFHAATESEGILPALETSHALGWLLAEKPQGISVVNLSGRGDKDLQTVLAVSSAKKGGETRDGR